MFIFTVAFMLSCAIPSAESLITSETCYRKEWGVG